MQLAVAGLVVEGVGVDPGGVDEGGSLDIAPVGVEEPAAFGLFNLLDFGAEPELYAIFSGALGHAQG